jgi:putative GTP pyrophosphokinase
MPRVWKEFDEEYEHLAEPLRALSGVLDRLIQDLLRADGIRYHSVASRVKSRESAARKVGAAETVRSLDSLTDMLGLRIITYFRDEVDAVARVIEREFNIDELNSVDKRTVLDPDRFGYLSLHYVAQLGGNRGALTEYRHYDGIKFEIQIRSILQHAWAEIEHDLGYKSEAAVPRSIRRRFSRLAGLLEIADDEFVQIRREVTVYQEEASETIEQGSWDIEIDQDSLFSFAISSPEVRQLDNYIANAMPSKLGQRADRSYMGSQAERLTALGFHLISDVSSYIGKQSDLLKRFVHQRLMLIDGPQPRRRTPPQGITFYYLAMLKYAQNLLEGQDEVSAYPGISDDSLKSSLRLAMDRTNS